MSDSKERYYPSDEVSKKKNVSVDNAADSGSGAMGKGRRGGNAEKSYVFHSGKTAAPHGNAQSDRREYSGQTREIGHYKRTGQINRSDWKSRETSASRTYQGNHDSRFNRNNRKTAQEPFPDFSEAKELKVVQNTSIGSFLALPDGNQVLLPFAEQERHPAEGDTVTVTLYEDKGGRLTATMRSPILKNGEMGVLKVADITRIGIFLDNGVPKQLLVPFKEQICTPEKGSNALVYLYRDKSGRQAATMRVYKHLSNESPYQADDHVQGFVYEVNPQIGVFVAVDNRYFGLIPKPEVFSKQHYGQTVECRVIRVRDDGKLDLSLRGKSYETIEKDAAVILAEIEAQGGALPYADRADAAMIEEVYHMSKNQFKRAVGSLYRQRKITIDRKADTIRLLRSSD